LRFLDIDNPQRDLNKDDIKLRLVAYFELENIYFGKLLNIKQFIGFKSKWKTWTPPPGLPELNFRADFEDKTKVTKTGDRAYKNIIYFRLEEDFHDYEKIFNEVVSTFKSY
jgi:hypothetical protein